MPKFSAVMPAYNAASYVAQSIQSVINQTMRDWELVVVDDGSTDSTGEVVEQFRKVDTRVKLTSIEHGGTGVARNTALENAAGEYVVPCDSDDICFPDRFLHHEEHFDRLGAMISAHCRNAVFDEDRGPVYWIHHPSDPKDAKRMFSKRRMGICNGSSAFRREFWEQHGPYEELLLRAQDYCLFRKGVDGVKLCISSLPGIFIRDNGGRHLDWKYFEQSNHFADIADSLIAGNRRRAEAMARRGPSLLKRVLYRAKHLKYKASFSGRVARIDDEQRRRLMESFDAAVSGPMDVDER